MPKKKYRKWDQKALIDELLIFAKVGLEAPPKAIKDACEEIGNMTGSGINKRTQRIAQRRLREK